MLAILILLTGVPQASWAVVDLAISSRTLPPGAQQRGTIILVGATVQNLGDEPARTTIALATPGFGGDPLTDSLDPVPGLDTCPRRLPCEAGDQCMDVGVIAPGSSAECALAYRIRTDAPFSGVGIYVVAIALDGGDIDHTNNTNELVLGFLDAQSVPTLSHLSLVLLALGVSLAARLIRRSGLP